MVMMKIVNIRDERVLDVYNRIHGLDDFYTWVMRVKEERGFNAVYMRVIGKDRDIIAFRPYLTNEVDQFLQTLDFNRSAWKYLVDQLVKDLDCYLVFEDVPQPIVTRADTLYRNMQLYDWPWSFEEVKRQMSWEDAEAKEVLDTLIKERRIRIHMTDATTSYYEVP